MQNNAAINYVVECKKSKTAPAEYTEFSGSEGKNSAAQFAKEYCKENPEGCATISMITNMAYVRGDTFFGKEFRE